MSIVSRATTTPSDEPAAFWLKELKAAHSDLLNAIEELERLTQGPAPRKTLLVDTRWRVSKASLARRLLWGRIHAFLSGRVDSGGEKSLRELQAADNQLLRDSTRHVGTWPPDSVLKDWSRYCRESVAIRAKMIDAIMTEKQLLYPILEEAEKRS